MTRKSPPTIWPCAAIRWCSRPRFCTVRRGLLSCSVRVRRAARSSVGAAADVRLVTHDQAAFAILEAARSSIDLIVILTHARSSLSRALLGSVVDKVLRAETSRSCSFAPPRRGRSCPQPQRPSHTQTQSIPLEKKRCGNTVPPHATRRNTSERRSKKRPTRVYRSAVPRPTSLPAERRVGSRSGHFSACHVLRAT